MSGYRKEMSLVKTKMWKNKDEENSLSPPGNNNLVENITQLCRF